MISLQNFARKNWQVYTSLSRQPQNLFAIRLQLLSPHPTNARQLTTRLRGLRGNRNQSRVVEDDVSRQVVFLGHLGAQGLQGGQALAGDQVHA